MSNYNVLGQLKGAFGELLTAELTPVVQVKFPYNINVEQVTSTLVGSGTVTHADSMAVISTNAASSSSAEMITNDIGIYQPGQGMLCRFTAIFTPGKEGSSQIVGIGDDTDGYLLGFNGTQFGILCIQDGVEEWNYLPELGDGSDDFRGKIDFTKGNIYQIQYQWLGFGQITFSMYNVGSQKYETIYRVNYPNSSISPSTYNPSFPLHIHATNTTNDTNIEIRTSSMALFIEGNSTNLLLRNGKGNTKIITTETAILTLRNKTTYQSKVNRSLVFPDFISLSTDGTKPVQFNFYGDTTLGGTPSYADIGTNTSVVEYDTAGTTATGGKLMFTMNLAKDASQLLSLGKIMKLHAGQSFTITAQSASSSDVAVSVSWQELT